MNSETAMAVLNRLAQDLGSISENDVLELRKYIQRLTVENNLKTRAVDRWVPCPDHRDKTDDQGCYVCRIEKLQARLAADQQKGGGCNCEVSAGLAAFHKDDCRAMAPQPSIPAPAQQDGKASGGEATDAMAKAMLAALNDPFNQWHTQIDRMKIASRAAYLAHPPQADQEPQS